MDRYTLSLYPIHRVMKSGGITLIESIYMDVKYRIQEGKRELFLNEIEKNNIEKLSSIEKGNICYQYTLPSHYENEVWLTEIWQDEQSQKAHLLTEHFQKLKQIKNLYVIDTEINQKSVYAVQKRNGVINGTVVVPGSKSMTNRALLLAALTEQKVNLQGVLFSDDSRHFLQCLQSLGYQVMMDENEKRVEIQGEGRRIPNQSGTINVGSAGTAARFLTALLALSDGTYTIQCSEQMKRRPMKPLFDALTEMGARFSYLENQGFLPVQVIGNGGKCKDVTMSIEKSTQFLSALLMVLPITDHDCKIHISSEKKDGAYIQITRKMMEDFGSKCNFNGDTYEIIGGQKYECQNYEIEPDVSAACYFYAIAALTGGSIIVKNVHLDSMQGDIEFVRLLKKLGCVVVDTTKGIRVTGSTNGLYQGIDVDMNNFSDQALTLAALAAFAKSNTIIRNVAHIRGQECDRIQAIVNNLNRIGANCSTNGTDIFISPQNLINTRTHGFSPILIETYDDHRVAMAFSLLGVKSDGIFIENPLCCKKTFENYFDVFESLQ